MRGFIRQYADGVFEPEAVRILTKAFDDAWAKVRSSKAPYATDEYASVGRTIVAKHIINAAILGEMDPRSLAEGALLYLSRQKLSPELPSDLP
jgi:hypothetical protein